MYEEHSDRRGGYIDVRGCDCVRWQYAGSAIATGGATRISYNFD